MVFSFLVKRVKFFPVYTDSHFKPIPILPKLGRPGYPFDWFPKQDHTGSTPQDIPALI